MPSTKHHLVRPFRVNGHWWIPGVDKRVAGILSYEIGRMELELYGGLTLMRCNGPFQLEMITERPQIIHGRSVDRVKYSVLDSFYLQANADVESIEEYFNPEVEIAHSRLNCSRILEGTHYRDGDLFQRAVIKFPGLVNWLGGTPFNTDMQTKPMRATIKFMLPEAQEFHLQRSGFRVKMFNTVSVPNYREETRVIKHNAGVEVIPDAARSLEWFTEVCANLGSFLGCCYGGPVTPDMLQVFSERDGGDPISIYFPHDAAKTRTYRHYDFLVPYASIKEGFGALLDRFVASTPAIRRTQRILMASENRPADFIDSRLLTLMHAVESLTCDAEYSQIVDRKEYRSIKREMLRAVPDGVPAQLQESLCACLRYGNGDNLRGRISGMLNTLKPETRKLFSVDTEKFIAGIVTTRNYHTHYSKQKRILQGIELHWAIEKLRLMIRIVLLIQAGAIEESLNEAIRRNGRKIQERVAWSKLKEEGSPFVQ